MRTQMVRQEFFDAAGGMFKPATSESSDRYISFVEGKEISLLTAMASASSPDI